MSHQFTVSKRGRRLIKAFEGFRPVDRTLVTGQRVVGYGHKVRRPEAVTVTRSEANALLKSDLAPYEDMINTEVHAPLNQNQFDALVSLAFSIGPKAFLESPTLHLLNNGRPLDAARSIEIWRKSRIDGKAYVVDALVRRRAQEKALFLRPIAGIVPASRVYLQSVEDSEMKNRLWDEDLPVFEDPDAGYVSAVPYEADDYAPLNEYSEDGYSDDDRPGYEPGDKQFGPDTQQAVPLRTHTRRREDGPAGILTLSEVIDNGVIDDVDETSAYEEIIDIDDILVDETSFELSPIAVAAAEVSDRLDALIGEDAPDGPILNTAEWPESLITADEPDDVSDFSDVDVDEVMLDDVLDTVLGDDLDDVDVADVEPEPVEPNVYDSTLDEMDASELRKIARNLTDVPDRAPVTIETAPEPQTQPRGLGPYLIMVVTALTLMGASLGAMMRGGTTRLGESMPFWSAVGLIVGAAILFFALYYILKSILRRI